MISWLTAVLLPSFETAKYQNSYHYSHDGLLPRDRVWLSRNSISSTGRIYAADDRMAGTSQWGQVV